MGNVAGNNAARVLVIEDEPIIREVCRLALDGEGFQIDTVENGDIALHKLRGMAYDLCLMDIRMPAMNGIELCQQLKIEFPQLLDKIIFITGDLMNTEVTSFLNKMNRPILPKPFTPSELRNIIRKTLGLTNKKYAI